MTAEMEWKMEYRKFENLGVETSLLGFGCMRFPKLANGKIDEILAEKMIDEAIASGVRYIDTAYPYHNGDSEPFVGRVLDKYDRKQYLLATKLPTWDLKTVDDAKRIFEDQLQRLNKEYVDFYLLHALDADRWHNLVKLGVLEYCEQLKKEGKIRFLGFSFHDSYEVFEEILTSRKWDFCQIQFNYMDADFQAGLRGYHLAERSGVPMVIMEPVKGGSLAQLPQDIAEIFKREDSNRSMASWALRWVGTFPNVKTVLSGMSDYEQVKDNLETFRSFQPLSDHEKSVVQDVAATIRSRVKNGCTGCRYCMPCPHGVNIPKNFSVWNTYAMYGNADKALDTWNRSMEKSEWAKNCIRCGKCEQACPQGLHIRKDLEAVQTCMDGLEKINRNE